MPNSGVSTRRQLALEVQDEVRRLATEIDSLDERAAARFGVVRTDLRCLDVLTSRGPLRPSDLAAAVRLTSGGLSIALDRLERAGYVRRTRHPTDRRGVIVEATELAHRVDEEIFGEIEAAMRRLLARYDGVRLSIIRDFLRDTRDVVASR